MPINVTTTGSNTVVTITFTAPTARMTAVLAAISEAIYSNNRGLFHPLWATLTNQEKLDIIEEYVRTTLASIAHKFAQKKAAGDAAKGVARADYEF